MSPGIILRDHSLESYCGIILLNDIAELYYEVQYGNRLRNWIAELYYGITLRSHTTEL